MVQINSVNNQNLTFARGNMPAKTRKIAEQAISQLSCRQVNLPGQLSSVRVLEHFPGKTNRIITTPFDSFEKKLREKTEKAANVFL